MPVPCALVACAQLAHAEACVATETVTRAAVEARLSALLTALSSEGRPAQVSGPDGTRCSLMSHYDTVMNLKRAAPSPSLAPMALPSLRDEHP